MRKLWLAIFVLVSLSGYSQSAKNLQREIRFLNTYDDDNSSLNVKGHELSVMLWKGFREGLFSFYLIPMKKRDELKRLTQADINEILLKTTEEWDKSKSYYRYSTNRVLFKEIAYYSLKNENKGNRPDKSPKYWSQEEFYFNPNLRFSMRDFHVFGIDRVTGEIDGEKKVQTLFVHLYLQEKKDSDNDLTYKFSVKWKDLLKLLKEYPNELYYHSRKDKWWRGDVFITNNEYTFDFGMADHFITASKKNDRYKLKNGLNSINTFLTDTLKITSDIGELYEINLDEVREADNVYKLKKLNIRIPSSNLDYYNGDTLQFNWITFLNKNKLKNSSDIYSKHDAFVLGQYNLSSDIEPIMISQDGEYLQGGEDPFVKKITPLPLCKIKAVDTFKTSYYEWLQLKSNGAKHIKILPSLLMDYFYNRNLTAYASDSLETGPLLSAGQLKERLELSYDADHYYFKNQYKKGDIVNFWGQLYRTTKDTKSLESGLVSLNKDDLTSEELELFKNHFDGKLPEGWVKLEKHYYNPNDLYVVSFKSESRFNKIGKNKTYELKGITLKIPHDHPKNLKGIELNVASFSWKEVKPLFLRDHRAVIEHKNKKTNLAEILENREFFSFFLKTGTLEAVIGQK